MDQLATKNSENPRGTNEPSLASPGKPQTTNWSCHPEKRKTDLSQSLPVLPKFQEREREKERERERKRERETVHAIFSELQKKQHPSFVSSVEGR